jgi:hypothetical protein
MLSWMVYVLTGGCGLCAHMAGCYLLQLVSMCPDKP